MQWLDDPLILDGEQVRLEPYAPTHYETLLRLSKDERIWQYYPENGLNEEYLYWFFNNGLEKKALGTHYPFVVIEKSSGDIIGTTRFGEISVENRRLEIGWTWYHSSWWGKGYNEDCKYIMLQYCFEKLDAVRVEINAGEHNHRSRRAIVRIGATFEGVLRNRMVSPFTGKARGTACHSVLKEEWAVVKPKLAQLRDERYAQRL